MGGGGRVSRESRPTWALRKSTILTMNFSMPCRLAITAQSEMPIVRPLYLGWLIRAKMMPSVTAVAQH